MGLVHGGVPGVCSRKCLCAEEDAANGFGAAGTRVNTCP